MAALDRVAVVIPCFDDGQFVGDAVDSARAQGASEIIVVDDGSEDAPTLTVLAALESDGVQIVRQPNSGLSAARMAGVAAATAPYVQTLDADDRLAPDCLKALAEALDEDERVMAVWGDVESFGHRVCTIPRGDSLDPWRITYLCEPQGASVMARRSAILSVGGWDMGSGYEDWDFMMKAAGRGWRGRHIGMTTLLYREHARPRMYAESRDRHGELLRTLESRHPSLFAARRRHWRSARAPWLLKLAWPVIRVLPGLSPLTRESLYTFTRNLSEPWMASSCAPSTQERIRRVLGRN